MPQALAAPFAPTAASPLAGRTILQIIPTLQMGGAERITLDIATALAEVGARALVATAGGRLVSELQARGGVWVPFPADARNPVAMLRNVRSLAQVIRAEAPALVHAQSRASAWVALGATRLTRTPFLTTYHDSYPGRNAVELQYNSVMARGDAVLANSHFTGEAIASLYPWARDRVRVVWPGIDLRAFSPAAVDIGRIDAIRLAWGIEPGQRIVLLAGRLVEWKGHRVLIDAAATLQARGLLDTVFILAGEAEDRGAYAAELDRLAVAKGVSDIVRRVGHCADMPAAYMAASLAVVPSTRPEAFGLSAVESQAMGVPVIVSDLGAIPETVLSPPEAPPEHQTGWRVPPGDAVALAGAIETVLRLGATALDALSMRARSHVERRFASDRMTEAVLDAYSAVLEDQSVATARHAA